MSNIYVGDNGTVIPFTVKDDKDKSIVNLSGARVVVTIKKSRAKITKEAIVTDATNGKCQITLTKEDVDREGRYTFQITAYFPNDNEFSSNTNIIPVEPLI